MDDPIFDPWSLGEDEGPVPSQRTTRWRSTSRSQGGPDGMFVPRRLVPAPTSDADREPALPESQPSGHGPSAPPGVEGLDAFVEATVDPSMRPPPGRTGVATLRSIAIPRCEEIGARLSLAGHGVTLDDRTTQDPPRLRFRVEPRAAPFDEPSEKPGGIVEMVVEGPGGRTVSGSIWLDPLSYQPTLRRVIETRDLDGDWIDRILVDMVERALRRA